MQSRTTAVTHLVFRIVAACWVRSKDGCLVGCIAVYSGRRQQDPLKRR